MGFERYVVFAFTDGTWGIWKLVFSATGPKAMTGQAKIVGNDPLNLKVIPLGATTGSAAPYGGRYPCGSLVHNGVWYYGTYCLDGYPSGYNWGTLGPFVGFRISKDYGLTWEDTPHTPLSPLFGETAKDSGCVKIGAPHLSILERIWNIRRMVKLIWWHTGRLPKIRSLVLQIIVGLAVIRFICSG